jgi:SAM-dependent methyltransferase
MSSDDDSNPFASTEAYYASYRPGYGAAAIRYLDDRFDLDGSSRVLDLGCGTGQIAVPLAAHVGEVVGMDPNEEMLRRARRRADAARRENVEWIVGSDADLDGDLGTFRLVTMGRSFHWMDQERTLERIHRLTEPEGGVAICNDAEWFTRGTKVWQDDVYALASEYVGNLPDRTGPVEYDDPWDELIEGFGFTDVEVAVFESEREWDVESVVGYVLPLSYCSPATFGEAKSTFEDDLRTRLDERAERFVQDAEVTVIAGRKEPL